MAEFNTISFKNIDTDIFVGRFDGEDYKIQPGETLFLPSHISTHLGKQLIERLLAKEVERNKIVDKEAYKKTLKNAILGGEKATAISEPTLTTKQKAMAHNSAIKRAMAEREVLKKARQIEAMKLAEEQKPAEEAEEQPKEE